ncbi:MAG: citramalate synthase [Thermaerobacter sp.]|nr:citramalate synthase [Thermaerobacter sp.]
MGRILLYDTTLRDGTQRRGISLSIEDKIQVAGLLDQYGMDYIEGGWPASNPKDTAFFQAMRGRLRHAQLAAFGSTRRKDLRAEDDPSLRAILEADVPVATLFGKASVFHAERILGADLTENLHMVEESVRFLAAHGLTVIFDAEHFFDGLANGSEYPYQVVEAALAGGAAWLVLCDTNGGSLPSHVRAAVVETARRFGAPIGIHAHNDAGLGVANSLEAVAGGAAMVQGTINGYGERCGNANLCTIWPNLVWKMGLQAGKMDQLGELTRLSRMVSEIANLAPDDGAPYVGENAFTHKAGVHAGAVRKHPEAYEHVDPARVGQTRRILVSELAGRSNLLYHFDDIHLEPQAATELVERVKRLEAAGYQFEDAESSMRLMVQRQVGSVPVYYAVDRFHVSVTHDLESICEATVRLRVGEIRRVEVGEGAGPVNALDDAVRKALTRIYPILDGLHLTDYKVRVLDGRDATAAAVRVWIRSEHGDQVIQTVGVSRNILVASWQALLDAIDYLLWNQGVESRHGADPVDLGRPAPDAAYTS